MTKTNNSEQNACNASIRRFKPGYGNFGLGELNKNNSSKYISKRKLAPGKFLRQKGYGAFYFSRS
jgi:hypothetical protein